VIGASGEVLVEGISISVDPKVIPYGTKVYINGKEYLAQDCGGSIIDKRIDVYFENHADALKFGKRYANVEIEVKGG
jgi:3D (Asp-Asp-Asp) domain-containing protein